MAADFIPFDAGIIKRALERAKKENRRFPIPPEAGLPIAAMRDAVALKDHPCYKNAKTGDPRAAAKLVKDFVSNDNIEAARKKFIGKEAIFVYPTIMEGSSINAIPQMMAEYYARLCGGECSSGAILQVNKVYHTGADPMERLISRPVFAGIVRPNKNYVLLDDVISLGGTLAELSNYIQSNGGRVIGTIALANANRHEYLTPEKKYVRLLEERYGKEIREEFGVEPAALTRAEARYLIGFRSADELRARIDKAQDSRKQRISIKTIRGDYNGESSIPRVIDVDKAARLFSSFCVNIRQSLGLGGLFLPTRQALPEDNLCEIEQQTPGLH